jgi:type II restriction/modification system DNA methylase subunit YeeA
MNTAKLKTYAPQARKNFIAAVTARAHQLGISEKNGKLDIAPSEKTGDIVLIAGQAWPAAVHQQRDRLIQRIQKDGFAHTVEAVAYTWFNRFAALRYMELHDYLGHGYRVLSSREGGLPEILAHANELAAVLPGLNATQISDLSLAGNKDGELYRLLLVAQCNALSSAMPFLFERIDDESESLLPDNLIRTDSLIRSLVTEIPESDWAEIEIIGWLYQFYISEKKDQVIGTVVPTEDIPAATQLFTPNWIVKYMVQNSLGAQWLATYPDSPLKKQMEYYIDPAEQSGEVETSLRAITPSTLNPEELTLIDPASGSGHILVEAYDLFKAMYLERGYRQRDVAQLILQKNLYGLDIDERAAQLTGFALMMKGRADDRHLFERRVRLNVMTLMDSQGFDAEGLANSVELGCYGLKSVDLTELKQLFENAKTLGALIQVPEGLSEKLPALTQLSEINAPDLFIAEELKELVPLVQQAKILAGQYDAVVANPPYMGSKLQTAVLKKFALDKFEASRSDLFSMFIERVMPLARPSGWIGMVSPFVWLFLSSYEKLRTRIVDKMTLSTLIQLEYNAFEPACVPVATFTFRHIHLTGYVGSFIRLTEFKGHQNQAPRTLEAIRNPECGWLYRAKSDDFKKIPGTPIAFWASSALRGAFDKGVRLNELAWPCQGLSTADTNRFLRRWTEVSASSSQMRASTIQECLQSKARWFPHSKGGGYRRWYGNNDWLIDWEDDGKRLKNFPKSAIRNSDAYFRGGISWCDLTSSLFNARRVELGFTFDTSGPTAILKDDSNTSFLHGYMNSKVFQEIVSLSLQGLHYNNGTIGLAPVIVDFPARSDVERNEAVLVKIAEVDWNAYERSWRFQSLPLLAESFNLGRSLESSYAAWITKNRDTIAEMKRLEEENNRLFIDAYGLADVLTPDVPKSQITLTVNPAYRYGGSLTEEEQWARFCHDTMTEVVSYAVGCIMGRYSLDEPGLIYAHAGNIGFDATRYETFPADSDGIVPVTGEGWFEDDAASRVREFVRVTWGVEKLDRNLAFLAANLGAKESETADDTLRRYMADNFYKDHLQTYKKRPIYWMFSSGKQEAFQALVYLHRYHEGTLARMRAEYVVPLIGKMQARIAMLEKDRDAASSTAARNKIAKQIEVLKKKHVELLAYDEKLRHYADMRIQLDLDDGVKANYGKFGDLLAEVKVVTGGAGDE